jgi:hypothetical protein
VDPGAAIRAAAALEDGLDPFQPPAVLVPPSTQAAAAPGVVPRRRHAVQGAHTAHGELLALRVDESEDLCLLSEQNQMAFFKSSCSAFSTACSRSRAWRRLMSRTRRESTSTRLGLPLSTPFYFFEGGSPSA